MPQNPLVDDNGNPISAPLVDDSGNPISTPTPAPESKGILSQAYDFLTKPLYNLGEKIYEKEEPFFQNIENAAVKARKDYKDYPIIPSLAEMTIGLNDTARSIERGNAPNTSFMTSPIGIGMTAAGMGEGSAIKPIATAARATQRALSLPLIGHGLSETLGSDSTPEQRAFGLFEAAGGGLGMLPGSHTSKVLETPEVPKSTIKPKVTLVEPGKYRTTGGNLVDESGNAIKVDTVPPAHNYKGQYDLTFEHPIDEALWTVAKTQPGPKRSRNIQKIVDETGVDHARAVELSKEFKNYVNKFLEDKNPGEHTIPQIYGAEPQAMKVPGVNPDTGRENIAMGGGSPRVLQVLGSSLYSNDRPTVVMKELLQNAFDEHREIGETRPIRVLTNNSDKNPQTGDRTRSLTIRDFGRGLTPEQLYKVFTDVGETGKAGVESASGGFGFAKAAPMLSGEYVKVESIVKEGNHNIKYVFEGNPHELINQAKGVPLRASKDTGEFTKEPTGLKVTTHFPENSGLYSANDFAKGLVENSPSITSPIERHSTYYSTNAEKKFLEGEMNHGLNTEMISSAGPLPNYRDTLSLPGADVKIHYAEPTRGSQSQNYRLNFLNKGLFQGGQAGSYGWSPVPNVPTKIFADIIAKVEEGHPDYPYTANREQLNSKLIDAVDKWIDENIVKGAQKNRLAMLQRAYDEMILMGTTEGQSIPIVDQGGRFTPRDLATFENNPAWGEGIATLNEVHNDILDTADKLGWTVPGSGIPSARLKKFGLLFAAPDKEGSTTLGIHIPNPSKMDESAILINLAEHLKRAENTDKLSTGLFTTVTHEQAHIPGGGHDTDFAYRHAQLLEALGRKSTSEYLDRLNSAFGDENGQIKPELRKLLEVYDESRKREASKDDPLLGTGVNQKGPTNIPPGKVPNGKSDKGSPSWKREVYELSRGIAASEDISAPFNQGFGAIGYKEWYKSWIPMFRALGSEAAYNKVMQGISRLPVVEDGIAHDSGLALMDLGQKKTRNEELLQSRLAEKILPGVRASNRAYTAFLNNLRATMFQKLYDSMPRELQKEPYHVKELAQAINDMTGRGRHEFGISKGNLQNLPLVGRMMPDKDVTGLTISGEKYSKALNDIFFAPRKMSATVRMLNPGTYITLPPYIRQQYLRSLITQGIAYAIINQTLQAVTGGKTSYDPSSADFGKIKMRGGFRIGAPGGFMPYLVAASRLASGKFTSSTTGKTSELGQGFKAYTRKDVLDQFLANKLHPTLRFAYDLAAASNYQPFSVMDRTLQTYSPMIAGDLTQLLRHDKNLAGLLPALVGMGTQIYDRGGSRNVFFPNPVSNKDLVFRGGDFRKARMERIPKR